MSLTIPDHWGEWTVDDLDALPETKLRLEIQDGNLVVSPSPGRRHLWAAQRLVKALISQVEPAFFVGFEHDITLASTSVRRPDVFIAPSVQFRGGSGRMLPSEVLLAIEIVSPTSARTDRILKPAEYSAAGIPGFWRIELDPVISLTAYCLGTNGYDELGTWGPGEVAHIDAPVTVTIPVDTLT